MNCGNRLCIYQSDNMCTIKEQVEIDWHGLCKNIVPISISNDNLCAEKIVTKLEFEDGQHHLNSETGIVTIIDKVLESL